jgi:hypothetical protein
MNELILGATLLSLAHAVIPNHWLPIVAIAHTENWSLNRTRLAALVSGGAHILSTIIIGIFVGILGMVIMDKMETVGKLVAPAVLLGLGAYNIVEYLRCKGMHTHHHKEFKLDKNSKRFFMILLPITIGMFFSPCIELEAYYLQAASLGWKGVITVSLVYFVVTLCGIMLLVDFGLRGVESVKWQFLEHREQLITGSVLVIIGLSFILF